MSVCGSCQCGRVQYSLTAEPLMTYACHCQDCQKRTGSAFSMGAVIPLSAISLSGDLSEWQRISDKGNVNSRYSCNHCGNIVYGVSDNAPELAKLQAGTLADTRNLDVEAHIWVQNKQQWLPLPETALVYQTQPDELTEIYAEVIARREGRD